MAPAALQDDLTMAKLVKKFDVHANQISDWKTQLPSNASDVFGKSAQMTATSSPTHLPDGRSSVCARSGKGAERRLSH